MRYDQYYMCMYSMWTYVYVSMCMYECTSAREYVCVCVYVCMCVGRYECIYG